MQQAPMCVCWSMFAMPFRRAMCAMGGVDLANAHAEWDDLAAINQEKIIGVIRTMVAPQPPRTPVARRAA